MVDLGPSFTREISVARFEVPEGASYLRGHAVPEERSVGGPVWRARQEARRVTFEVVTQEDAEWIEVEHSAGDFERIYLHDQGAISGWLASLAEPIFVDMTSLALRTWAPILRAALSVGAKFRFVYVEPSDYVRQLGGRDFSLSDYTEGISSIPGFASVASITDEPVPLIAMLGFEGARLTRIIQRLEPPPGQTFPVIGVPGYKVEFPFYSYEGNQRELEQNFLYSQVVHARANCPFEAFVALSNIRAALGGVRLQVAPIGTKPHAVAAALFALACDGDVELIYDHPKRAARPTQGASRVCVYYMSEFIQSRAYTAVSAA